MLTGIVGFSCDSYDGEAWQTSWDSTVQDNSLPLGVILQIDFLPSGNRVLDRPYTLSVPMPVRTLSTVAEENGEGGA